MRENAKLLCLRLAKTGAEATAVTSGHSGGQGCDFLARICRYVSRLKAQLRRLEQGSRALAALLGLRLRLRKEVGDEPSGKRRGWQQAVVRSLAALEAQRAAAPTGQFGATVQSTASAISSRVLGAIAQATASMISSWARCWDKALPCQEKLCKEHGHFERDGALDCKLAPMTTLRGRFTPLPRRRGRL